MRECTHDDKAYIYYYASPLGDLALTATDRALTGLWFDGDKLFGGRLPENCSVISDAGELQVFSLAAGWLDVYFEGRDPAECGCPLPALSPSGSAYRKRVWDILQTIPYGEIMTYGEIAARMLREDTDMKGDREGAADPERMPGPGQTGPKQMGLYARAVGGAVGHNPISIIIPCHRVLGSGGKLTGYGGGIDRKIRLLELENITGWK